VTLSGGDERIDVRCGDLAKFRDAFCEQVGIQQVKHRSDLGQLFA
jgi:hypothetical protein